MYIRIHPVAIVCYALQITAIYSDCQNNVPIGARLNCLDMGAYANRRKFVRGLRERPQIKYKDGTGGYDKQLRDKTLLGLHGFLVSESAAVDERRIIVFADRIRIQTE